ncbi:MAG: hypothetical protein ABJP70_05180 [Erythrobacter sp.]
MPYRSTFGAFDHAAASTISAVLPASIKAGLTGSICVVAYLIVAFVAEQAEPTLTFIAGVLFLVAFALFVGTMIGAILCAFSIALLGLPLALMLGRKIEKQFSLGLAIFASLVVAIVVSYFFNFTSATVARQIEFYEIVTILCYAIPAGYFYREDIILVRALGDQT